MSSISDAADEEYSSVDIELQVQDSCISPSVRNAEVEELLESGQFPLNVVIEILSRLPVKTLFRFKLVCKNWDAVIPRNSYLVSMHLKNYTNNPATKPSLFCNYHEPAGDGSPALIPRSVSLCLDGERPINIDENLFESLICGAGNGLFLLSNQPAPDLDFDYSLWNPATREFRLLPDLPSEARSLSLLATWQEWGAGVDLAADDVKVVLIHGSVYEFEDWSVTFESSIFVYTVWSNCWRELVGVSYPHNKEQQGRAGWIIDQFHSHTYFKGFLFWIIMSINDRTFDSDEYVVAFDMGNDVFHRINYPVRASDQYSDLSIYRYSIALFHGESNLFRFDVWLLNNINGQYCWIKHSVLDFFPEMSFVNGFYSDSQLLVDMRRERQLVLFDIDSKNMKALINNYDSMMEWDIYKESSIDIK